MVAKKGKKRGVKGTGRKIRVTNAVPAEEGKRKRSVVGPAGLMAKKYENNAARHEKQLARVKNWVDFPDAEIVREGESLLTALHEYTARLTAHASWKPARGTVSNPIEIGAKVKIKKTKADKYEGILEPDAELKVLRIVRNKVVCVGKGPDGDNMKLPVLRSHIEHVAAA